MGGRKVASRYLLREGVSQGLLRLGTSLVRGQSQASHARPPKMVWYRMGCYQLCRLQVGGYSLVEVLRTKFLCGIHWEAGPRCRGNRLHTKAVLQDGARSAPLLRFTKHPARLLYATRLYVNYEVTVPVGFTYLSTQGFEVGGNMPTRLGGVYETLGMYSAYTYEAHALGMRARYPLFF